MIIYRLWPTWMTSWSAPVIFCAPTYSFSSFKWSKVIALVGKWRVEVGKIGHSGDYKDNYKYFNVRRLQNQFKGFCKKLFFFFTRSQCFMWSNCWIEMKILTYFFFFRFLWETCRHYNFVCLGATLGSIDPKRGEKKRANN